MDYFVLFLAAWALLWASGTSSRVRRLEREVERLKAEPAATIPPPPDGSGNPSPSRDG